MIVNFADKDTESIARGYRVKQFDSFARIAQRKLRQLEIAGSIQDLRIPPGNRLEKLAGNRDGQWSLRINNQFGICFRWTAAGPADVEIVDYH